MPSAGRLFVIIHNVGLAGYVHIIGILVRGSIKPCHYLVLILYLSQLLLPIC